MRVAMTQKLIDKLPVPMLRVDYRDTRLTGANTENLFQWG